MSEPVNGIEGLQSVEVYEEQLKLFLMNEFPCYYNTKLEDMQKEALSNIDNEDIQNLIPGIISLYVDSSSDPLSELSKKIMNKLSDLNGKILLNSEEIAKHIHKISTRKNYGKKSKNQYEDNDKVYLLCWELFSHKQPNFILRERSLIGNIVKSLDKLIQELKKENPKSISELFSSYNKHHFTYKKYKEEQTDKKRKKQETEEIKSKKNQEKLEKKKIEDESKKLKIEEEKRLKLEESQRKKEEQLRKKEEEKKKLEEKKKEDERKKEEKKREEEEKRKELENKNTKILNYFQKVQDPPKPGILKNDSAPVASLDRKNVFIYFSDSFLKPYFTGPAVSRPPRLMLSKYESINYEKDSEEEFAELNGEDIEHDSEEEEEDSPSSSELESLNKFIIADNHLSEEEKIENEELEFNSVWMNTEIKPMQILSSTDPLLETCKVLSITNEAFPIKIPEKPQKKAKEAKPLKIQIDETIEKDILKLANGMFSKDDIIATVLGKYPNVSKAGVKNLIKEKMIKLKTGPKSYVPKQLTESLPIN